MLSLDISPHPETKISSRGARGIVSERMVTDSEGGGAWRSALGRVCAHAWLVYRSE
jgi:hypothetical protein